MGKNIFISATIKINVKVKIPFKQIRNYPVTHFVCLSVHDSIADFLKISFLDFIIFLVNIPLTSKQEHC